VGPPLTGLNCIEVDPQSGNYLTCSENVLSSPPDGIHLVAKDGSLLRTLALTATYGRFRDARFCQDGTVWVLSHQGQNNHAHLLRMDTAGTIIKDQLVPFTGFPQSLEIYGSRKLVCNQQGKTVKIRLKSHRPGDGGKSYVLACSFNRRAPAPWPSHHQPFGGEILFLDYTNWLFYVTVNNLFPSIFQNFRGLLDAQGNNVSPIAVNIPASLPPLNMTVFVAGVIFSAQHGVHTVTNTHWFVL